MHTMESALSQQIRYVEGFDVRVKTASTSSFSRSIQYPFQKSAPGMMTVAMWRKERFQPYFKTLDVEILNSMGIVVHPRTLLRTVRESY